MKWSDVKATIAMHEHIKQLTAERPCCRRNNTLERTRQSCRASLQCSPWPSWSWAWRAANEYIAAAAAKSESKDAPKGNQEGEKEDNIRTEMATFGAGCFWGVERHLPPASGA